MINETKLYVYWLKAVPFPPSPLLPWLDNLSSAISLFSFTDVEYNFRF
jgi:hypothetical protein